MNILTVENIRYTVYPSPGEAKDILRNISFNVNDKSICGISGESGSGKTTLAKIIAGHLTPSSGTVNINAAKRNNIPPVQMLFQNTGDILNPFRKIFDVIKEAAALTGEPNPESETEKLLDMIKLSPKLWNNRGYQLSGGEQQRAALARLLAVKPKLLILDEPFAAQDVESQVNLISLLTEVKKQFDLTIMCISHNIRILKNLADKIIVMKDGGIVESGDNPEILFNPKHSYTQLLIKAENYSLNDEELKSLL